MLDLDRQIFSLQIDLDREKKIRELYEGLLFLAATAKKQFESGANRSGGSGGGWFGLGELFGSSSPPRPPSSIPRSSFSQSQSHSHLHQQQQSQQLGPPLGSSGGGYPSLPFTSTAPGSRPMTPVTPIRPVSPAVPTGVVPSGVFETPVQQSQQQLYPGTTTTPTATVSPMQPPPVPIPPYSFVQGN